VNLYAEIEWREGFLMHCGVGGETCKGKKIYQQLYKAYINVNYFLEMEKSYFAYNL
jgi:hypothetical protein